MWLLLTMSSNTRRWNATTLAPLFLDKNEKTAPLISCFCNTKRAHFQGKNKKNYQILPQVPQYVVDCQVSWCPRRLRSNLGEKTKSLPDYGVLLTAWWSACHATNIVQDYRERNTNRHFFFRIWKGQDQYGINRKVPLDTIYEHGSFPSQTLQPTIIWLVGD